MTATPEIRSSILDRIGHTPLIELGSIVPDDCSRILIKIESENPSGSMKDRMALAMIEAAERDGRLKPGGHVIEYTGGSTGVSLALICAVKGYKISIATSDAFSVENRNHILARRCLLLHSLKGQLRVAFEHLGPLRYVSWVRAQPKRGCADLSTT